ncbi:hypothetical protein F8S13_17870 [Chloroflexia bacterium SDU3-3]|nr:hypothetical protein F8S13_17870 [Chloroflexia bacterium SDU3-3]
MTTDHEQDQATSSPASTPQTSGTDKLRERIGDALLNQQYPSAVAQLSTLSISAMVAMLHSLYITYPFSPLIAHLKGQQGSTNQVVLAALYIVTGEKEEKITPLFSALSTDQQSELRKQLDERKSALALLRSLNNPLLQSIAVPPLLLPSIPPPLVIPPLPASPDSALIEGVKKAITAATDGVTIRKGPASANLSVSGLTTSLQAKGATFSLIAFPMNLTFETSYKGLFFSAKLSEQRWDMQLTFSLKDPIPSIASLSKIFSEGEQSMRKIVAQGMTFRNLNDISRIQDAIKPYTQPVSDAVSAAKGIAGAADAKPFQIVPGITASGPGPFSTPGAPDVPKGQELQLTITVRF